MPKILINECIDRRLAREITGHEVSTVPEAGWAGLNNGDLLTKAQHEFDIFITIDQNLPSQQNLSKYDIAVVVLRSSTNRLSDLVPLIPEFLNSIASVQPGTFTFIGSTG
ncbi:MAG TPA: hypothetical protein ENI80_01935 [Acidiferrobacteraceae bacterium]|nr:hypothetical protein [Acidiferrobacteraceae bacterium]